METNEFEDANDCASQTCDGDDTLRTLEHIRSECDRLIALSTVEKEVALDMLKVFHNMETLYTKTVHDKRREIEALQAELVVSRITNQHADTLKRLVAESATTKTQLASADTQHCDVARRLSLVEGRASELEQRIDGMFSKRR